MHKKFENIYYFIDEFKKEHIKNIHKNINIIFRNYKKKPSIPEMIELRKFCHNNKKKLFISNNINLAIKVKADGLYIPSFNNKRINIYNKKKFKIIGSAHNLKQIREKERQKTEIIFLSPLFKVQKRDDFLDIYKFRLLKNHTLLKTVALDGLNLTNIKKLNLLNISGYASISYIRNILKKKND